MIDPHLQNKIVLITGTNNPHGIGAATASAFAHQGAKVLISYLRPSPNASASPKTSPTSPSSSPPTKPAG